MIIENVQFKYENISTKAHTIMVIFSMFMSSTVVIRIAGGPKDSKNQIPSSSSNAYTQEDPYVVGHGEQH